MKSARVAPQQRIVLSESEQVAHGHALLQMLQEQPSSCKSAPAQACCSEESTETDVKVIVKRTFIEVVDPECPECPRRCRSQSDSALFHKCDSERTWQPLPTMADLSDASTTISESQEELTRQDLDVDLGASKCRTDTCWSDKEDQYMQDQSYAAYQYVESWWIPMPFDPSTGMMCAMPDGSSAFMSSQWADQSNMECEGDADQEWRTTVMLRNMPNNYTRDMLLEMVDSMGFAGCYDFAYLPVDFKSQAGLGYAFINFVSSQEAQRCFERFEGFSDWKVPSEKVCTVTWGSPYQGLEAHVERYQNSPVMHHSIPDEWKPVLFDQQGVRIPFPVPTKAIKTPKVRQQPTGN